MYMDFVFISYEFTTYFPLSFFAFLEQNAVKNSCKFAMVHIWNSYAICMNFARIALRYYCMWNIYTIHMNSMHISNELPQKISCYISVNEPQSIPVECTGGDSQPLDAQPIPEYPFHPSRCTIRNSRPFYGPKMQPDIAELYKFFMD